MREHPPRLLVTGGAGFIGAEVAVAALRAGCHVTVLDSLQANGPLGQRTADDVGRQIQGAAGMSADHPSLVVIEGDISDRELLGTILPDIDVVSHQAAKVGLEVAIADAPDYVAGNDLITAVLLAEMARHRVDRFVLASSMVVYGDGSYSDEQGPITAGARSATALHGGQFEPRSARTGSPLRPELTTEEAVLDPRNVYATTKLTQEFLTRAWARATGGRAALLRYHNVYGPHMPPNTPYAGVAAIFRSALSQQIAPRVFEDGLQRRDFVHVSDVARANVASLQWLSGVDDAVVQAFNVGSGEVHTVGEMASALAAAFGGPAPVITGEFRLGDVRHITASSARIRAEMAWLPAVSFAAGMKEFATAPMRGEAHEHTQGRVLPGHPAVDE